MAKEEIFFTRHLDEEDDLKKYGRDAPLREDDANRAKVENIVETLAEKIERDGKKAVLFVTSPRLRAVQTAHLAAQGLSKKIGRGLKFRFSTDDDLKATEQGEILLPEDYSAGDFFEGLDLAGKIFGREVFGDGSLTSKHNLHYRFGDPVVQRDGSYRYPELAKYFKDCGETYAETLIRIFTSIIELSEKAGKLDKSTELVIVTHGQIYHIVRGLAILGEQIQKGEIEFKSEELISRLWGIYNKTSADQKVPGICLPLEYGLLRNEKLIDILKKEVEFLKGEKKLPEPLVRLQQEIASLPVAKNIVSFLVYGSAVDNPDTAEDLDIIVVVKEANPAVRSLFNLLASKYSKVDFHIYTQEEVSDDFAFHTREFVLEYLAKGVCLLGQNLFAEQYEQVSKEQYKHSLVIRSIEYLQMVRKKYYGARADDKPTAKYLKKYFIRLSKCLLLIKDADTHTSVNQLHESEIYKKMHELGIIKQMPNLNEQSTASDYFEQFDVLRDALLQCKKGAGF